MHDHESSPPDLNGVEFLLQLLENFEKGGAALQIIVRSWVYEKYFVQHREYWERVLSVDGINRRLMINEVDDPAEWPDSGTHIQWKHYESFDSSDFVRKFWCVYGNRLLVWGEDCGERMCRVDGVHGG